MYRQFNIQQFYVLPTQSIYVVCVDLRTNQWRTQEFYSGRVQQIQLRTERTGIWGQWPPSQGFWRQL
jgi:hypothetical protein